MMTTYLLPHRFKSPSRIVFLLMTVLFILELIFSLNINLPFLDVNMPVLTDAPLFSEREWFVMRRSNLSLPLLILMMTLSGLGYGFSREKDEDELIAQLRSESLVWAVYLNYLLLALLIFVVVGFDILGVMIVNIFTLLVFFNLRFEWKKYQLKKSSHEE
ncbi:MAG: hypothetical protein WBA16_10845 [Nonlabens sp.]